MKKFSYIPGHRASVAFGVRVSEPTVLILDDVEDSREMYAEYLRHVGCSVDTASNGEDGLVKAFRDIPEVVILDLTMPRLDGWEVMRRLRGEPRTERTFIVVVSGHALTGSQESAMEAGADVFLSKPCLPEDLYRAIVQRPKP